MKLNLITIRGNIMKKVLMAFVVLAMATSAFASDKPAVGVSGGMLLGVNEGHAVVGTGVMYKGIGGDFYGNNDRYGSDLKVAIPLDSVINKYANLLPPTDLIAQVGVAIKSREIYPAGGAALNFKFPIAGENYKSVGVSVGYHTEMGVNVGVNLGF